MPLNVIELSIEKYDMRKGKNTNETVCSRVVIKRDLAKTRRALHRLVHLYENKDNDLIRYTPNNITIKKYKKNSALYDMGEIIFSKQISKNVNIHKKSAKRFAKYLQDKENNENIYYTGNVELVRHGYIDYRVYHRSTDILDIADRKLKLKRKISAKKGTLTKSINEAKKIRTEYSKTLFPDDYVNNTKYKKLISLIWIKRNNLKNSKKLTINDIPETNGNAFYNTSASSVEKIKKVYLCQAA